MTPEDYEVLRSDVVREAQAKTNAWLIEKGFWFKGQTRPGLMKVLADFRRESAPKPAGKDWARILLSRVADGFPVCITAEKMARDALRMRETESDGVEVADVAMAE